MKTTLQRLLKYPHNAVFDVEPGASLALRIRHPNGARWAIADEVLTVTVGAVGHVYQLGSFNVGQLAAALVADGFEVPTLSDEWIVRSALVLAEGGGDQGESNGDHVYAFTSILWALMTGYAGEVRAAAHQVVQALRQMVLPQAELEWLDLWGALYGVPRLSGELDEAYAPRIEKEAFRIRVSVGGIEQAIIDATGWDVRIEEPWKEIFTLDQSMLSGPDRFYDGDRYGYHLIRPFTRDNVDWAVVLPIIDRNRAAGVLVIGSEHSNGGYVAAPEANVYAGIHVVATGGVLYEDRVFLDYMAIEDVALINHPILHQQERRHADMAENLAAGWGTFENGTWAWSGAGWSMLPYFAQFEHQRDYRTIYFDVRYAGQSWADTPGNWNQERSWNSDVFLYFGHTRS